MYDILTQMIKSPKFILPLGRWVESIIPDFSLFNLIEILLNIVFL